MSSLRRLFEQYSDRDGGIDCSGISWHSFRRACASHGLASPTFDSVLASVAARMATQHRRATFEDVCTTAASLCPESSVDKTLQDLQIDASALHRYVAFVRSHFKGGSFERRKLEAGSEDLAESFRGTLLHLLRLAAREAEAVDALERNALLSTTPGTAGGSSISAPLPPPSPYDFQRLHAHAAAVRLAACCVKAHALQLQHRLYAPPPAASQAALAEAAPAVLYAVRAGASYEDCAQSAIPYELEVVRLPLLPSLCAIASSSITLAAYASLCAAVRGLGGGEEEGEGGGEDQQQENAASGTACAAAALTSGALTLPAPSVSAASQPRATLTSSGALHTDYCVASELVLSPYFADPCGILEGSGLGEGSGEGSSRVLGVPTLFCYEYVPDQLPLSQLVSHCGPLAEQRPLFRHLATELLGALCDIEAQCTHALPATGTPITLEHMYVSECGSRVSVRGVPWGAPLPSHPLAAPQALAARSRTLARCYGAMLRALLPGDAACQGWEQALERESVAGEVEVVAGSSASSRRCAAQAAARVVRGGQAEAGVCCFAGEVVGFALGDIARSSSLAAAAAAASSSFSAAAPAQALAALSPSAKHRSSAAAALRLQPGHLEGLPVQPLRSSSPVKRAGGAQAEGGVQQQLLQQHLPAGARWLPPILQLPGRAVGDAGTAAGVYGGVGVHMGLPVEGGEAAAAAGAAASSSLPPAMAVVHCSEGRAVRSVPCSGSYSDSDSSADFYLTCLTEGQGVLWFFAVSGEESNSSSSLFRAPPRPSTILTEIRVPFSILPAKPSPTLCAILATSDPRLEQSPALSTVRLLVSLCSAPRIAAGGVSAEAAFVQVARELSAVLEFNVAGGGGGLSGGGAAEEAAAVEGGSLGGGAGAAGDALAALVAALEADEGEGEGGGGGEGDWMPLGGLSAGSAAGGSGRKWLCHLAKHPYFERREGGEEGGLAAACEDYNAWAYPVRQAQR